MWKKIVIILLIFVGTMDIFAQEPIRATYDQEQKVGVNDQEQKVDIIIKSDGTKIEALVQEVDIDIVKYKLSSNPTGPMYSIRKSDIASILYSNGTSEVFAKPTTYPATDGKLLQTYGSSTFATGDYTSQPEYLQAKSLNTTGSVLGVLGLASLITGVVVGCCVDAFIGFVILVPVGAAFFVPGVVLSSVGSARMRSIKNSQQLSLYEFQLNKNAKYPVNLAVQSNGLSLKF